MPNVILLIDDEPVFNFIAESHIKRIDPSAEVFSVFNGKEAITFLEDAFNGKIKTPTHIFLDLNMPIMDGFSFLTEYKKLSKAYKTDIQVIIVTSSTNLLDKARTRHFDVNNYINKPISTEQLKYILNIGV